MSAFTSRILTKQLTLYKSTWNCSPSSLPVSVLFLPHLFSKPRHHAKYIDLYADFYRPRKRPVDLLLVSPRGYMDICSISRVNSVSNSLLKIVQHDAFHKSSPLIVHAISIGNFYHGVNLDNDEKLYNSFFRNKIVGQLFECPVGGLGKARKGVVMVINEVVNAVFPKDFKPEVLKPIVRSLLLNGMAVRTTWFDWMDVVIDGFKEKAPLVPTLTIHSRDDPLIDSVEYGKVIQLWKNKGMDVDDLFFKDNVHAAHLLHHADVYKKHFNDFLAKIEGKSASGKSAKAYKTSIANTICKSAKRH